MTQSKFEVLVSVVKAIYTELKNIRSEWTSLSVTLGLGLSIAQFYSSYGLKIFTSLLFILLVIFIFIYFTHKSSSSPKLLPKLFGFFLVLTLLSGIVAVVQITQPKDTEKQIAETHENSDKIKEDTSIIKSDVVDIKTIIAHQERHDLLSMSGAISEVKFSSPSESRNQCDKLAGSPFDPLLPPPHVGIPIGDIDASSTSACKAAVFDFPEEVRLKYQLARILLNAGNSKQAVQLLIESATANYYAAMLDLSSLYMDGIDVEENELEAIKWLKKAAGSGSPVAMNNLGVAYARGAGTEKSIVDAKYWLQKATDEGLLLAKENALAINTIDNAVQWIGSLKTLGEHDIAKFCASDYATNGNIISKFNLSGVGSYVTDNAGEIRVIAVGAKHISKPIARNRGAIITGEYGTLFIFSNGSFVYNLTKAGENSDVFTYQTETESGKRSIKTLILQGKTWIKNKAWIVSEGKSSGTADGEVIASYKQSMNDEIHAFGGDDALFGWSGDDLLDAGEGNDVLFGEYGADKLWGGRGADIFVVEESDINGGYKGKFYDTVYDFNPSEGDIIYIGGVFKYPTQAQNNPTKYLRYHKVAGGVMIQVNQQEGAGWQNALLINGGEHCDCSILKDIAEGNIAF